MEWERLDPTEWGRPALYLARLGDRRVQALTAPVDDLGLEAVLFLIRCLKGSDLYPSGIQ